MEAARWLARPIIRRRPGRRRRLAGAQLAAPRVESGARGTKPATPSGEWAGQFPRAAGPSSSGARANPLWGRDPVATVYQKGETCRRVDMAAADKHLRAAKELVSAEKSSLVSRRRRLIQTKTRRRNCSRMAEPSRLICAARASSPRRSASEREGRARPGRRRPTISSADSAGCESQLQSEAPSLMTFAWLEVRAPGWN